MKKIYLKTIRLFQGKHLRSSILIACILLTCLCLGSLCTAREAFQLRTISPGQPLPSFEGPNVLDHSPLRFTPQGNKPTLLIFFTLRPPYRQERSLDLIGKVSSLISKKYADQVELIAIYSDNDDLSLLKKYIKDGLIPVPVIHDGSHKIYNKIGIFMTPLVVIVKADGTLHEVIPAVHNIENILDNNIKLLLGLWSMEDFENSFKKKASKQWSPAEKEYLRRINYGKIMFKRKMLKSALREYTIASKLLSKPQEAYIGLGSVYFKNTQYDRAEESFQKALHISPESDRALAGLGMTLYKLGKTEKALPILENAMISANPDVDVLINLAEIYENQGDYSKAMRLNKMVIDILQRE